MALIDSRKLGKKLQKLRREAGYKNTTDFSKIVKEKAKVEIAPHRLDRIEQGRVQIYLSEYLAINKTIFGLIQPNKMHAILFNCLDEDDKAAEAWAMNEEYDEALFLMTRYFARSAGYVEEEIADGPTSRTPEQARDSLRTALDVVKVLRKYTVEDDLPEGGR